MSTLWPACARLHFFNRKTGKMLGIVASTRAQYPGRIGAKFWALRELLVASWSFHTFKSLHVLSQQLAGVA